MESIDKVIRSLVPGELALPCSFSCWQWVMHYVARRDLLLI
jgi:hypothetical protein